MPMGFALRVYEAFKDDEVKARILTELAEMVEQTMLNRDLVTRQDLSVTELKLLKEIEQVRVEVYKVKASILKWLIGLLLTQTITIIGVILGLFQAFK